MSQGQHLGCDVLQLEEALWRFDAVGGQAHAPALELACHSVGYPGTIRVDQGPEFISRDLDLWAYQLGVELDFSRPVKSTDNAFIESFDGTFRSECPNAHWFLALDDARLKMEEWRKDYYTVRRTARSATSRNFTHERPIGGFRHLSQKPSSGPGRSKDGEHFSRRTDPYGSLLKLVAFYQRNGLPADLLKRWEPEA